LGKKSNLVLFQSHALCQQDRLQAQGWILGKDKEAVVSGPSFSEIPCPLKGFAPLFSWKSYVPL